MGFFILDFEHKPSKNVGLQHAGCYLCRSAGLYINAKSRQQNRRAKSWLVDVVSNACARTPSLMSGVLQEQWPDTLFCILHWLYSPASISYCYNMACPRPMSALNTRVSVRIYLSNIPTFTYALMWLGYVTLPAALSKQLNSQVLPFLFQFRALSVDGGMVLVNLPTWYIWNYSTGRR